MPSAPPPGVPAPIDGVLPDAALTTLSSTPLSFYLHVPYCQSRCGYCDFNTYTASELGPGVSRADWKDSARKEVDLARRVLGTDTPAVSTVFVGGGTPTLLPAEDLASVLRHIDEVFGLADDVEVTTEANPDSVTPTQLEALRSAGFNRISFGMQSVVPHVLKVLERTHTPGNALESVNMAKAAGFEHINLDLIYGTPSESLADLRETLAAIENAPVDHVSAYALIVEDGTRLAHAVKRGVIPAPSDDDMADKYEVIDDVLTARGFTWYEVSNWSLPGSECRHNVHYWKSHNWWGVGPGAHSHIDGVRWWNHKHPTTWTQAVMNDESPALARELLSASDKLLERVLLETRLSNGIDSGLISRPEVLHELVAEGLMVHNANGQFMLTRTGRLLADAVVHRLVD